MTCTMPFASKAATGERAAGPFQEGLGGPLCWVRNRP